jgi:hypothetical protein
MGKKTSEIIRDYSELSTIQGIVYIFQVKALNKFSGLKFSKIWQLSRKLNWQLRALQRPTVGAGCLVRKFY